MNDVMNIERSLSSLRQDKVIGGLLYGSDTFDKNERKSQDSNLHCKFIKDSHRFDDSLFSRRFK